MITNIVDKDSPPATSVASQAEAPTMDTSGNKQEAQMEGNILLFGRSMKIMRSPIRRASLPDYADVVGIVDPKEEKKGGTLSLRGKETKRKRQDEAVEKEDENKPNKLKSLLIELGGVTKALEVLSRTNVNTKAEIKQKIRELALITGRIKRSCKEMEHTETEVGIAQMTQTEEEGTKEKKDAATQTEENLEGQAMAEEVEDKIKTMVGWNSMKDVICKKWLEEVFVATKVANMSITKTPEDVDMAIVLNPDDNGDKGLMGKMKGQQPQIGKILKEKKLKPGGIAYIRTGLAIDPMGDEYERDRYTYLIGVDESSDDREEQLHRGVTQQKEIMEKKKREQIAIATCKEQVHTNLRKIAESIFHESTAEILVHEMPRRHQAKANKKRTPKTETLIISREGNSYADLLKTIRSTFSSGDDTINKIRRVRKTRDDKVVMTVEAEQETRRQ